VGRNKQSWSVPRSRNYDKVISDNHVAIHRRAPEGLPSTGEAQVRVDIASVTTLRNGCNADRGDRASLVVLGLKGEQLRLLEAADESNTT